MATELPRFDPPSVPGFEVLKGLAASSRSVVQLARDAAGRRVALKILRLPDGIRQETWRATWEKLGPLTQETAGLMPVWERGFACQNAWFYSMPAADDAGEEAAGNATLYTPFSLRLRLKVAGPMATEEVRRLGLTLAPGLERLHSAGLVHCDVKPSNVFFHEGRPKLADYDLVAVEGEAARPLGTEGFFPPGETASAAADVYALGKTLYEAWTGLDRLEFPSLPPGLAGGAEWRLGQKLNQLLLRTCSPQAGERFRTAADFRNELQGLDGRSGDPRPNPFRPVLVGAAAVGALVAGLVWFRPPSRPENDAELSQTLAESPTAPRFHPLDLRPWTNALLDQTWQYGSYGIRPDGTVLPNHLGALPVGRHVLGGIEFEVSGVIQLSSSRFARDPRHGFSEAVTNLPFGRLVSKLHFLHACTFRGGAKEVIGRYRITLEDGSVHEHPMVFGGNLADWWQVRGAQQVSNAPVVIWRGTNSVAAQHFNSDAVLYGDSWSNPKPAVPVKSLDILSAMGPAGPVVIGISGE